jgi:hypothetical protein
MVEIIVFKIMSGFHYNSGKALRGDPGSNTSLPVIYLVYINFVK